MPTSAIAAIIQQLQTEPGCSVLRPSGIPSVSPGHMLPEDVITFYENVGGASLFSGTPYAFSVVPPHRVIAVSAAMLVCEYVPERSDAWYVIVEDSAFEYLSVDCSATRHRGRCYDNFHEHHPFEAPVVAASFTELLSRLLLDRGQYPFYLERDFSPLGDGCADPA